MCWKRIVSGGGVFLMGKVSTSRKRRLSEKSASGRDAVEHEARDRFPNLAEDQRKDGEKNRQ